MIIYSVLFSIVRKGTNKFISPIVVLVTVKASVFFKARIVTISFILLMGRKNENSIKKVDSRSLFITVTIATFRSLTVENSFKT